MPSDIIRIGPVFWISELAGVLLTFALVFLEMVSWALLAPTCLIAFFGGLLLIILAGRVGMTREGFFSSNVIVATVVTLLALVIESFLISAWFNLSVSYPSKILLVNVLFAIYEETLFLGVAVAGKAAGLPDTYIIVICALVFVPYHLFVYPIDMLLYIVVLGAARVTMDASRFMTDHSDPSFLTHIIWNVLATLNLFGGI
ncbi:MAG: type II CAAX prenyl endopeptidase Rce1 family protein [Candidatus Thorarchaeota archaeon]